MARNALKILLISLLVSCLAACGSSSDNNTFGPASEDNQPAEASVPNDADTADPAEEISSELIWDFLWKPQGEHTGNLVILVNPYNARVVVTGAISETLINTGASNGRGTTARSAFSGCTFGNEVKVEFFDPAGRRIRVKGGADFVTVPQGCSRFEFKL